MKKYDEMSVVRILNRNSDISVNTNTKVIEVSRKSSKVGNSSWGKIDYLCNYCGYVHIGLGNIDKHSKRMVDFNTEIDIVAVKPIKSIIKTDIVGATTNKVKRIRNNK